MIRRLLRTIDGLWAFSWSISPWGMFTDALDRFVDRISPPVRKP